jgi:tRNA A37 threonylcarbamoyladenosine modification protein TsaB
MKLFIDTTSNQQTVVQLGRQILRQNSRLWHSQVVLPMIEKLLNQQKKTLKDISKIEVKTGQGSLTGIRVGQAIKQALGFALGLETKT